MRTRILASAMSLLFASQVYGQQVVSYSATVTSGQLIASNLPSSGFVLTDILIGDDSSERITLSEVVGATATTKFAGMFSSANISIPDSSHSYHFRSGIPFVGGSDIRLDIVSGANPAIFTISGFIPGTASAAAPAMSDWGTGIMLLLVLAVGGVVFSKTRLKVAQ